MSRFPRSEPDIAALAMVVTQGLGQASDDFPTPPVAVDEMQGRLDAYRIQRRNGDGSGSWELADTSVETEHMLSNQPRGVGLEYRCSRSTVLAAESRALP